MNPSERLDLDRLSVTSGAILLGLAATRIMETSGRNLLGNALGSRLDLKLSFETISLLILTGMAVTAVSSLVRTHPQARSGLVSRVIPFWIVPGLLVFGLAAWAVTLEDLGQWMILMGAAAILIPSSLALEYAVVDPGRRRAAHLSWVQMFLIFGTALLLFSRIFDMRVRALISGPAIVFTSALLSGRLFWIIAEKPFTAQTYGMAIGIFMGLLTWVLSYWPLTTLTGATLIFLFFYVTVGTLNQYLHGRFGRGVVLEYVGLAMAALLFIFLGLDSL
jgi:hypothetical protein